MIRFIIETTSSKTDVYGNRYHFATITSTKTGKYLQLDHVGGPSNAAGLVRRTVPGIGWDEIHSVNSDEAIRRFNELRKYRKSALYEHQVTAEMLAALETE